MVLKIDLHTHSTASPDGGVSATEYASLLKNRVLDFIAVTDHDRIDMALELQKSLGDHIIVGQEITTTQGELIGLFLNASVQPGLDALTTAKKIVAQGGLVYVPHPFETVRKGISKATLDTIANLVDIVEVHNGRAFFQNKGPEATSWARLHNKASAASSDAHGKKGLGTCYNEVSQPPTAQNLVKLLATSHLSTSRPPIRSLLYPKLNRIRAKLKKT